MRRGCSNKKSESAAAFQSVSGISISVTDTSSEISPSRLPPDSSITRLVSSHP
ncbi:unnamed protein product [Linum tenue]|uniref:Uncharacterized protein n=1 Tax=Linum tenue TaxID=586396 RepID=A0AAV0MXA4_9ROSI|nr:unnamed protein product [Linum tenue]